MEHIRLQAQNSTDRTTRTVQVGLRSRSLKWLRRISEACWLTEPRVTV